jgi:hypothetical protein
VLLARRLVLGVQVRLSMAIPSALVANAAVVMSVTHS